MADWFAKCEICNEIQFEPDKCVAFRRTSQRGIIAPADIRRVPSSGLACVCENCVRVLAGQLVKVPTLTEPVEGD